MQKNYDLAITPRWGEDPYFGRYLVYLSGASQRCGYSATVDDGDAGFDAFFTQAATGGDHEQEALRDLKLLSRVHLRTEQPEDLSIAVRPIATLQEIGAQSQRVMREELKGLLARPYVVLSPTATLPFRRWPLANYCALATHLRLPQGARILVAGGKTDELLCKELADALEEKAVSIAGMTNPVELVGVLAGAMLFVGNDSGPGHIAGGLGIPTVVISPFPLSCTDEHPNSPARWRPCGPRVIVVQPAYPISPCSPTCSSEEPHCISQVTPEQVMTAIEAVVWS